MKNLQIKKSNQLATVLSITLLMLSLISVNPSIAKSNLTQTTVFYEGEWITRVDMPEVTIEANRMNKGSTFLKNVETVYPNGKKTIHVTIEDVMISSTNASSQKAEITAETEYNLDSNLESYPVSANITASSNFKKSYFTDRNMNPSTNQERNLENKVKVYKKSTTVNKPAFNRVVNSLVEAGFNFLKKVNDGLFFKS